MCGRDVQRGDAVRLRTRGTLRRAWRRGESGEDDRETGRASSPETRRTPWPAAGCNRPAGRQVEQTTEVVRNDKGGTRTEPGRLRADGAHLSREARTWSGHQALTRRRGDLCTTPREEFRHEPARRTGFGPDPATTRTEPHETETRLRRRGEGHDGCSYRRHTDTRCRPDQVNLAGQRESAKVTEGTRESPNDPRRIRPAATQPAPRCQLPRRTAVKSTPTPGRPFEPARARTTPASSRETLQGMQPDYRDRKSVV